MSDPLRELKEDLGIANLSFYKWNNRFACRYVPNRDTFDYSKDIEEATLRMLLTALSMDQGVVYFFDVGKWCNGLVEIRAHYLPLFLAGI